MSRTSALRFSWLLASLLLMAFGAIRVQAQTEEKEGNPWGWKEDPKWEDMPFSCRLALADKQPNNKGEIRFDYEITAEQPGGTHFYNPFLRRKLEIQTCQFLIYNANKNFIGFGNISMAGSAISPAPSDWIYLPSGASLKYNVELAIPARPAFPPSVPLPPGQYYLQLSFRQNTVAQPVSPKIWREFVEKFRNNSEWKRNYVRSNPVSFEVKE